MLQCVMQNFPDMVNVPNNWKAECIKQIGKYYKEDSPEKVLEAAACILNTEYVEFPRKLRESLKILHKEKIEQNKYG